MIIPYGTGQIVQLDSFSVTDRPLSVTKQGRRQLFQVGTALQSAGYCLGLRVLSVQSTLAQGGLGACPPRNFLHALRLNLELSEPK